MALRIVTEMMAMADPSIALPVVCVLNAGTMRWSVTWPSTNVRPTDVNAKTVAPATATANGPG